MWDMQIKMIKGKFMDKRILISILSIALVISIQTGCATKSDKTVVGSIKSSNLNIVATLFPQYDFAKQIVGDRGTVTLLLPSGVDSHSYEPTPSDIIKINNADLFIYTGNTMEIWSQRIIDGMNNPKAVLDVSKGIDIIKPKDNEAEYHDHGEKKGDHIHLYDPHIWTSPIIAKSMINNILEALYEIDPNNANYYRTNAETYLKELDMLDTEFRSIVKHGSRDKIIFGSKFALYYFAKEYGIQYEAAFENCSTETEPSAKTVASLIKEIKNENIPVIYYAEISEPKVAKSISDETGAKMLLFHSCHNLTKTEFEQGATYLSLMKQNAKNLKEGLN